MFHVFQKKAKLTKEEIAKLLQTTPKALEEFERAYQVYGFQETNEMFTTSIKDIKNEVQQGDVKTNESVVSRIVNELVNGTEIICYTDGKLREKTFHQEIIPVTLEELQSIPLSSRPQLTGSYLQRQIPDNSDKAILFAYKKYQETRDRNWYVQFRRGLDILDLDVIMYEMIGKNQNTMGNWFPQLIKGLGDFFKVPNTTILKVPIPLLQLSRLDYEGLTNTTLKIVDDYCMKVFNLRTENEYFVKTGVFSCKFDFRNAHVAGEKEVRELGEYLLFIQNQSCIMSGGLTNRAFYGVNTTNEWVVREYIQDTEKNPCIYKGMPLHTEYRLFVDFDTNEVLSCCPYWDPDTMRNRFANDETSHGIHDYIIYQAHEQKLMERYEMYKNTVIKEVETILPNIDLSGQWSMDIMQNGTDFYIIDMALAEHSAFYESVPKQKRKITKENWIPDLSYEMQEKNPRKEKENTNDEN